MSPLIIGLICWLAIVVLVLGVLRAAGQADRRAERSASELGLAPAARVALAETATAAPGRARPRLSLRGLAKPSWAAAAVTLTALGMSVQQLAGFEAVVILAIAVVVCACLLTLAVVTRRRGSVIEHQAGELAIQRDTILSLAAARAARSPRGAARCGRSPPRTGARPRGWAQ